MSFSIFRTQSIVIVVDIKIAHRDVSKHQFLLDGSYFKKKKEYWSF